MFSFDSILFSYDTYSIFFRIFAAEMDTDRVIEQRNCALREAHKRIIAASSGINNVSRRTIISLIQEMSAPRFYITPFTAQLYINNNNQCRNRGRKQDMIADLMDNYNRLKLANPNAPKMWLYETVVEQPAKSFYMSAHRIEEIIFNYTGRNGNSKK